MKQNRITYSCISTIIIVFLVMITQLSPALSDLKLDQSISSAQNVFSNGQTFYVDDDNTMGPWNGTLEYPFQYIQDGVNIASDGDTVFVFSGLYYENIIVDKSIDLIGEDQDTAIIDGRAETFAVKLTADHVFLSGFKIQYAGVSVPPFYWGAGISIFSDDNTIVYNTICHNHWSIYLISSNLNVISNNLFLLNGPARFEQSSENNFSDNILNISNIMLNSFSNNNTIYNNMIIAAIFPQTSAIGILDSSYNSVSHNSIYGKWDFGVIIGGNNPSSHNFISKNVIRGSRNGIQIGTNSEKNLVISNLITNCTGVAGLKLGYTSNNILTYNTVINCSIGIHVYGSCYYNNITCNNFIDNPRSVRTVRYDWESLRDIFKNRWDGNYWGRERFFPKILIAENIVGPTHRRVPFFILEGIDWHPADEPYDIS